MSGNAARFDKAMNDGHNAAWEQDWQRAASFYRQALEEFPDNPKAVNSLALACFELKNYQEALVYYQRASELMPEDPIPLERISELLRLTGNPGKAVEASMRSAELYIKNREVDKAISVWLHVLSMQPRHLMARSRLALVYERLGKKSDAIRQYLAIASIYQRAGDVNRARQVLDHALQVMPESVELKGALAAINSGRLLPEPMPQATQESASAPPAPVVAATDEPDPVLAARKKALAQLAELVFEQLASAESEQQARKGLQSIVKGSGLFGSRQVDQAKMVLHLQEAVNLQSLYPDHRQDQKALEELERAVDSGLEHPAVSFDLGYLYFGASRLESAVRSLQRAVNHVDYAFGARLLLGQVQLQLGRFKEAATELLEALKIADMETAPADQASALGELYDPIIEEYPKSTPPDAAKQLCENILSLLRRTGWRGQIQRIRQQFQGQMNGGVLTPLADMLTQARSSQLVESMARIQQLSLAGKGRAAMEEAYYALQHAPTYLPLHVLMGEMLFQQNQIAAAVDKFKVIARCYYQRGDATRAISLLQRVVGISAMDVDARNQLIELLTAHGKMEEVVNEYMRLADVYYNLADLPKTREALQMALRAAQQSNLSRDIRVKVLQRMADIDLQSLDWRQALKSYEQIRNLRPDDSQVRKAMIDLYFRMGQVEQALAEMNSFVAPLTEKRQYDQALAFLAMMEEEHPGQPAILRLEADVLRLAGNTAGAVLKLDEAGDLYLQKGNPTAAKEVIMAILALNPPNAADYQALLSQLTRKGA